MLFRHGMLNETLFNHFRVEPSSIEIPRKAVINVFSQFFFFYYILRIITICHFFTVEARRILREKSGTRRAREIKDKDVVSPYHERENATPRRGISREIDVKPGGREKKGREPTDSGENRLY